MEKLKKNLVSFIIKRPTFSLLFPFFLTLIFSLGFLNFKSNYSPRVWFAKDHPQILQLDQFEKRFGGEQFVTIAAYAKKGTIDEEDLKFFDKITQDMWLLPDIIRVETVTNYNNVRGEEDDIIIEPLSDTFSNAKIFTKKVKEMELIHNIFVNKDVDFFVFNAYLRPYFNENPDFTKVVSATSEYIEKIEREHFDFYLLGPAAVTNAFRKVTGDDVKLMMPLMLLSTMLLLWFQFRNIMSVVAPIFLILLTIGSSLGILSGVGITYNGLLGALPGILMAICLADSIHLFITFYQFQEKGRSVRDSLKESLERNFLPTILTTVTTAISFLTISLTELVPINGLGIIASIGALVAWWYTYFLLPGFVLTFPKLFKVHRQTNEDSFISGKSYVAWIGRNKNIIISAFFLFFCLGIWKSSEIEVNADPIKYFSKDTPVKHGYDFAKGKLEGLRGINLVIDSGENEGVKNPEFLKRVDAYISWMKGEDEIVQVRSIVDVIKKLNGVLHPELKKSQLPKTRKEVAEQLFLYQISLPQGAGTENQLSLDNRYLRLVVNWTIEETNAAIVKAEHVVKTGKDKFGITSFVGGNFPIYTKVNKMVVKSFMKSLSFTILIVSTILLIVFKQFFISFLSMLPNILPLVVGTTAMAIGGIYLDIATSIVAAICLGIAVDDTIHFVSSYLRHKSTGISREEALENTYNGTGKALILTTIILVVGFGIFMFADFLPNRNFGMLCALVLSYALLTDLILLPAILLKWDKPIKLCKD